MTFKILAFIGLIIFYSVYIGKMVLQSKKGIVTDQMAKGKKDKKLFITELLLKIATYSIVVCQIVCIITGFNYSIFTVRIIGFAIVIIGDVIFFVSVYTMKDSWRAGIANEEKTDLITDGIYSISRNPAFLAFDLSYIGLLMMFFNPVLLVFSVFSGVMFHLQILQEEKFLRCQNNKEYIEYKSKVLRYLGRRLHYKRN